MKTLENKLNREHLSRIKGGNGNTSTSNINDEDAIGNVIRPRTSGIGGLMRPK